MASFNRVILVGNLTRDVELKSTNSGLSVTEVGLAVNDRRKNASGEWVNETTFVDVTMWGRTAEVARDYLSKGSPVLIEGRLKLDTWETEGQKRSKLRVVCERMQMLGRSGQNGPGDAHDGDVHRGSYENASYGAGGGSSSGVGGSAPHPVGANAGDDIPF
ncbi:MAG: single-stranded DNA-binding protein [Planctomycetes bacterium]|nr:single-stranded DNA-binding protein [Planctomycetota bacterium]